MLRETRHERLLRLLREQGVLPVRELAARLDVSEATVRRDLDGLQTAGLLTRVYGGAVARRTERPFGEVEVDEPDQKDAVAAAAAALVQDGETVLLDIGTTTRRMARRLRGRPVTVVTSSLAAYEELKDDEEVDLILLGGRVRRNYRSLVGYLTEENLRQVHADRLFLGAAGVLPDGRVMDSTDVEVPVKRAMLRAARQRVLLATPGKFPGTDGTARVCDAGDLDMMITNRGTDPVTLGVFREAGVDVREVPGAEARNMEAGAS
ncbi:ArsR family transcriptional regulator [Mangrovactinospora gilvigrisea]|uniref:Lactose phosphotransferase system repressor n=1 Tax=Mangrovactinospora gilvigrisea TaxID=1428644 RepID=A0A1J7BPH0_9ACTN|nr:DeoR/GlpR family DNA-binding transcription regulator [Mangrovactinospora gilvigrisea]OIV35345.1 ArsR family transcriptional regulator [Mangrovactinospora gilvigrisea]